MKRYVWGRIIRAIVSVFIVTVITMVMIYTLIPRELIFKTDPVYVKLGGKDDERTQYRYNTYEKLGYVDYVEQKDMCTSYAGGSYDACMAVDSADIQSILPKYEQQGYTVQQFKSGLYYAYRDVPLANQIVSFFRNIIQIDYPGKITDPDNPDMKRGLYVAADYNGVPAIQCVGCKYKYQWYLSASFPWIRTNAIHISLGQSYPSYAYQEIMDVLNSTQGTEKKVDETFETGYQAKSSLILHSCQYKQTATLDRLDKNKFSDNYANCATQKNDPSMVGMSMKIGIIALLIAYLIAIPAGMGMASHKDKFGDKIGTVYINFMIAVPSLAFIFFGWSLGTSVFHLPSAFPVLGAHDVRSYILPVLILALLNTSGIMLWTRRYMIDQASSDYVKFARAKGLSQREIFTRHIMRNAIIPIAQSIPANVILTISGAVLTETVFAIPGTGKLLPDAITDHNNQMIVALTIIYTSLSILSVLLGDLLITKLDPRIQLEEKSGGVQ